MHGLHFKVVESSLLIFQIWSCSRASFCNLHNWVLFFFCYDLHQLNLALPHADSSLIQKEFLLLENGELASYVVVHN